MLTGDLMTMTRVENKKIAIFAHITVKAEFLFEWNYVRYDVKKSEISKMCVAFRRYNYCDVQHILVYWIYFNEQECQAVTAFQPFASKRSTATPNLIEASNSSDLCEFNLFPWSYLFFLLFTATTVAAAVVTDNVVMNVVVVVVNSVFQHFPSQKCYRIFIHQCSRSFVNLEEKKISFVFVRKGNVLNGNKNNSNGQWIHKQKCDCIFGFLICIQLNWCSNHSEWMNR